MSNKFLDKLYVHQQKTTQSLKNSMGSLDNDGPLCCFCIPLQTGIILICFYGLLDITQSVLQTIAIQQVSPLVFIFFVVAMVPQAITIWIYLKFLFQKD